jgi:hypothetical protein
MGDGDSTAGPKTALNRSGFRPPIQLRSHHRGREQYNSVKSELQQIASGLIAQCGKLFVESYGKENLR